MILSNVALLSFAAPSTAGFVGISPKGAAWMPRVGRRAGSPLYRPPTKPRSAGRSGDRAAFSLDTFFWRSKRKYLAFGCENPIKNLRISDTKTKCTLFRLHQIIRLSRQVDHLASKKKGLSTISLFNIWRPQGGSNPCYRRERAVS
jgi:hypothetical protein